MKEPKIITRAHLEKMLRLPDDAFVGKEVVLDDRIGGGVERHTTETAERSLASCKILSKLQLEVLESFGL
jgi:hypothetical protein